MLHKLRNLKDFYLCTSGLMFLAGLAILTLRLLEVGPEAIFTIIGIGGIAVGLPLRIYSAHEGVRLSLEEERQFTHGRLNALESLGQD